MGCDSMGLKLCLVLSQLSPLPSPASLQPPPNALKSFQMQRQQHQRTAQCLRHTSCDRHTWVVTPAVCSGCGCNGWALLVELPNHPAHMRSTMPRHKCKTHFFRNLSLSTVLEGTGEGSGNTWTGGQGLWQGDILILWIRVVLEARGPNAQC